MGMAAAGMALSACQPHEGGKAAPQPQQLSESVPINPPSPDYFIPGRFTGKTIIVTGCARGMGAGTAQRAAREGANVVGVDWIEDLGAKTISDIVGSGGTATFVPGDIGDTKTCDTMVKVRSTPTGVWTWPSTTPA
jgi:hypothetical protein